MSIEFEENICELRKYSSKIGNNIDLIQGAGGNTSFKENNILWIKASGCWLSDADKKNIFVSVDCNKVFSSIERGDISDIASKEVGAQEKNILKPSIETALHALMPHKFVFHAHALNTLSIAILSNGKKYANKLLEGINWVWIPYCMPGIDLAKAVQNAMQVNTDVIILANHGIVVGGSSAKKTFDLLIHVEERMKRNIRQTKETSSDELLLVISKSKYRLSNYKMAHKIALDDLSLKIIETGTLYPDHVVFLGAGPMNVMTLVELQSVLKDSNFIENNPVIIVRNYGVIVHNNIGKNIEAMLYSLAGVLHRVQPGEKLSYLTEENEIHLTDWDAEKYRQLIQR